MLRRAAVLSRDGNASEEVWIPPFIRITWLHSSPNLKTTQCCIHQTKCTGWRVCTEGVWSVWRYVRLCLLPVSPPLPAPPLARLVGPLSFGARYGADASGDPQGRREGGGAIGAGPLAAFGPPAVGAATAGLGALLSNYRVFPPPLRPPVYQSGSTHACGGGFPRVRGGLPLCFTTCGTLVSRTLLIENPTPSGDECYQ